MSYFTVAIMVMIFTASPSVKTGLESEITYREHNMSKTAAADNMIIPPFHNTQDGVIHFLAHKSPAHIVHYVHLK